MPFFPFVRCELVSTKTPWQVEAAMRAAVEPQRFLGFGAATRPFEGEVGDSTFDVQRAIGYRNSFLPQIRGVIAAAAEGSRITVTMRLHLAALVFMTIWLAGAGVGGVLVIVAEIRKSSMQITSFVPAIMFIFGWALMAGAFTFEARAAAALLARTMMARPIAAAVRRKDV